MLLTRRIKSHFGSFLKNAFDEKRNALYIAICLRMEHLGVLKISLKFVHVLDRIGIILKGLVFKESGKIGVPQEKPLAAHVVLTPGFEPTVGGECCHHCATLAPKKV